MAQMKLPDGRVISFPDGLQPDQIKKIVAAASQQTDNQPGVGMDMLKSGGTGLAKGVMGMGGMLGDVQQMAGSGAGWLAEKLGAGQETQDMVSGVARRIAVPGLPVQAPTSGQIRQTVEGVTGPMYEPKTTAGKYAETLGEFAPGVLVGPGGIGARVATTATSALGSEAAGQAAQKYWPDAEPYARIGGAIAGGMAPGIARRVVTPLPVSPERAAMANTLKKEGVGLTAGQSSGNETLQYLESELGGGKAARMVEKQGEQFTSAALRRIGETADRASPEVIDRAFTRIGNDFDTLAARNPLPPDPQIATDLVPVITDYTSLVPSSARAPVIQSLANDLVNVAQNGVTGKQYQAYVSRISRMARGTNDPQTKQVLNEMRDILDGAMERHLQATGSADAGAFSKVRNQYRNLIVMEQAATGAGGAADMGLVSPAQLKSATINKHGRRNYARGQGDYAELARAGSATMRPLPNSGTSGRTAARNIGASIPAIIGTLLGSAGGPVTAAVGGLAGASVPYATGRALMSKPAQAYLKNQLLPGKQISPTQRAIINALLAAQSADAPLLPAAGR